MRDQWICLALVLCALHSACGLYFHISETERKCFIEEVPDETTVIGKLHYNLVAQKLTSIFVLQ